MLVGLAEQQLWQDVLPLPLKECVLVLDNCNSQGSRHARARQGRNVWVSSQMTVEHWLCGVCAYNMCQKAIDIANADTQHWESERQ